jgi:hypothetical protein
VHGKEVHIRASDIPRRADDNRVTCLHRPPEMGKRKERIAHDVFARGISPPVSKVKHAVNMSLAVAAINDGSVKVEYEMCFCHGLYLRDDGADCKLHLCNVAKPLKTLNFFGQKNSIKTRG